MAAAHWVSIANWAEHSRLRRNLECLDVEGKVTYSGQRQGRLQDISTTAWDQGHLPAKGLVDKGKVISWLFFFFLKKKACEIILWNRAIQLQFKCWQVKWVTEGESTERKSKLQQNSATCTVCGNLASISSWAMRLCPRKSAGRWGKLGTLNIPWVLLRLGLLSVLLMEQLPPLAIVVLLICSVSHV